MLLGVWALLLSLILPGPMARASASRISSDLAITARAGISVVADPEHSVPSSPATGNATQGATVSMIAGGVNSSVAVDSNLAVTGKLPLSGSLLEPGDGVGIASTMSGVDDGRPAASDGLFGDYALTLRNNSSTDAYKLSLKIDYSNSVQASGPAAPPDGAFNIGLITLSNGGATLFSTSLTSDTAFGDKNDVTFTGASGQPLSDSGTRTVEVSLQPGQTVELQGQHDLRGGASRPGALYRGGVRAFISLAAVVDLAAAAPAAAAAPPPATAPGTAVGSASPDGASPGPLKPLVWAVLALAGVALLLIRRRRK